MPRTAHRAVGTNVTDENQLESGNCIDVCVCVCVSGVFLGDVSRLLGREPSKGCQRSCHVLQGREAHHLDRRCDANKLQSYHTITDTVGTSCLSL